jgi:hypothetical protein
MLSLSPCVTKFSLLSSSAVAVERHGTGLAVQQSNVKVDLVYGNGLTWVNLALGIGGSGPIAADLASASFINLEHCSKDKGKNTLRTESEGPQLWRCVLDESKCLNRFNVS